MAIDKKEIRTLLDELSRIASALENPRIDELTEEVPTAAAASHLDYLAIRQLMGRVRRDGEPAVVFPAARKKGSGTRTVLTLGVVPDDAEKLAVFTQRGDPAEVVDLAGHPIPFNTRSKPTDYTLTTVTNDQAITRLEFRRTDDYPLGLGPRLPAV